MAESRTRPLLRLEILSQPRLLAGVRAMIGHIAERVGFEDSDASQISLAVDEALCNVISHGYHKREDGMIWITLSEAETAQAGPELQIVIEDRADQVDPATIKPRNLDEIRPGGLGVHIIREVMDEARYERRNEDGGGMRLAMRKRIPMKAVTAETPRRGGDH